MLKEEWIRAKYERKEFMDSINSIETIYNKGYMEGRMTLFCVAFQIETFNSFLSFAFRDAL